MLSTWYVRTVLEKWVRAACRQGYKFLRQVMGARVRHKINKKAVRSGAVDIDFSQIWWCAVTSLPWECVGRPLLDERA